MTIRTQVLKRHPLTDEILSSYSLLVGWVEQVKFEVGKLIAQNKQKPTEGSSSESSVIAIVPPHSQSTIVNTSVGRTPTVSSILSAARNEAYPQPTLHRSSVKTGSRGSVVTWTREPVHPPGGRTIAHIYPKTGHKKKCCGGGGQ